MLLDQTGGALPFIASSQADTAGASVSDAALLLALSAGDRIAFADLVERHAGPAFELACNMLDDEEAGEAVVQETFATLWTTRGHLVCPVDDFGPWLTGTVIRACIAVAEDSQPALPAAGPWNLRAALQAIGPRQRAAVILHYVRELAAEEIAPLLRVNGKTAERLLWTGCRALGQTLDPAI